jgi:hypothetical protein
MIGTPNVKPRPKCTNVVVQTAWPIVWRRSSIFLPSQTRGNVNNTPPTMIDRFITFESDAFNITQKISKTTAKRAILKDKPILCFIETSFKIIIK